MAIDSFDKVGAGGQYPREFFKAVTPSLVTGRPHSLFYLAGIPGAATASTAGLSGEALTSYSGQFPYTNAASGETNLCRIVSQSQTGGQLLLCDRLWHNSAIDVTSIASQTINSVAFPTRDVNGSSNGEQVFIAVEVTVATGAGTPTITLGYTNQSGTASRTATNIMTTVATSAIGAFYPIGLQAGDSGVRSVQTYQQNATWTSGNVSLVAYRVVARIEHSADNYANAIDWVTMGGPSLYDNSVLFLVYVPRTTSATNLVGHIVWTQG
jgi:hypothetical protein